MRSYYVVYWEEADGTRRHSRSRLTEQRATWLAQALMVRTGRPISWAEVRCGEAVVYRTVADEWR